MDKRLKEIDDELRKIEVLQSEVAWLRHIIASFPVACDASGVVYTSLPNWLSRGPDYVKNYPKSVGVRLLDRQPYYNSTRGIWYYYIDHSETQLDPKNYESSAYTIPMVIAKLMKADRVDNSKPYYDALPIGGWDSRESAELELNKAVMEWARSIV